MSHLIPPDDVARLAALYECSVLDTEPEACFDDLTALAAKLCGAPIALVSLIDETRQWFKSRVGCDLRETSRTTALCSHAIPSPEPLIVPDATKDDRFSNNPLVVGSPGIRFYTGVPLTLRDGYRVGTLCVIDTVPRTLSAEQLSILESLARQAAAQLELRRRVGELSRAYTALKVSNQETARANAARWEYLLSVGKAIREPMTAILGFSELLCDSQLPECDRREFQRTLAQNGSRLLENVDGILAISRSESSEHVESRVECEIEANIRCAMRSLSGLAAVHGVHVQVSVAQSVPAIAVVEIERLRQITTQVVGSAILRDGSRRVTLEASCLSTTLLGQKYLRLRILRTDAAGKACESTVVDRELVEPAHVLARSIPERIGLANARSACQSLGGDLIEFTDEHGRSCCDATFPIGTFQPTEPQTAMAAG